MQVLSDAGIQVQSVAPMHLNGTIISPLCHYNDIDMSCTDAVGASYLAALCPHAGEHHPGQCCGLQHGQGGHGARGLTLTVLTHCA